MSQTLAERVEVYKKILTDKRRDHEYNFEIHMKPKFLL